jgi:SHS2 domain-containing protein
MKYESIQHTADVGIRVRHRTKKGLFANAAFALFDLMAGIKTIESQSHKNITVKAFDQEELLNEFLNRLLREFTLENRLVGRVKIKKLAETSLTAEIYGEPYQPKKHLIKKEIKAVTFNDLHIKKVKSGYEAQIIFDV